MAKKMKYFRYAQPLSIGIQSGIIAGVGFVVLKVLRKSLYLDLDFSEMFSFGKNLLR
jgi:hypothetical protein